MTVFCVNSSVTYADLPAANAGEAGINYGTPTIFEISGTVSGATTFQSSDYASSIIIRASSGEEADGNINNGAKITGVFMTLVASTQILDIRANRLDVDAAANVVLRRLVIDGLGLDGVSYNDTLDAEDIITYNCDDGFLSSATRPNSSITKCTMVDCSRFGLANGKVNDSVALNTGNQAFFGEQAGSANIWEDDGSGTDTITESPTTDIFVDYAGGDYRILSTSSVGLANAGAFIESTSSGVTATVTESASPFSESSSVNISAKIEVSVTEVASSFSDSSMTSITPSVTITAQVTEILNAISDSSLATITEAGNISATVTELLSGFTDDSVIDISSNIDVVVTELLNSFSDDSIGIIQKDLQAQVTEILSEFSDDSILSLPVKINAKKLVKVIGNSRRISVRSNSRTIKVR